ncbi:hypothetical protein ACN20G_28075 (plasmid) [Streptomyces sp. BI20]|uniref:hypothetical protein n=1 Tax=Streptomyces sp. BI20 TaxID=3403460 RepID=UPI003C7765A8
MNHHMLDDAAARTRAAADAAPPRPEYDGSRFVPVRADHLAHLIATVERHGRILAALADHLGLDPKALR